MKPLSMSRVVVVGLGLMGGSLAAALCGRCKRIIGLTRRQETAAEAKRRGLVDEGTTCPADALHNADIVVFATPVRTILRQIDEFAQHLRAGCLVMDVGSTKASVLEAMQKLPEGIQPLGGHPMCGKETSGLEGADPDLYRDRTFILCPLSRTSRSALRLGRSLVKTVGARPLLLDAQRQDDLTATLSHLPYLMACSLIQAAHATTSSDPAAWRIVAGGFRDTSRVAGSDVRMMLDILATNQAAVLESATAFRAAFDHLVDLLKSGSEDAVEALLTQARTERRRMYP